MLTFNLLKVLYTGFEDLHILLAIDVHGHSGISSLGVCHLTEASAIGGGDTLDRTVRSVDVVLLIHGYVAVLVSILGSNLSVCKELVDPFLRCYETTLTMGCGVTVGSTQRSACNQGDLLDTTLVYTILEM